MFKLSSKELIINFNDLTNEFIKGVRLIFLYDFILHILSKSIIEEFYLAIFILFNIYSDTPKLLYIVLSRTSLLKCFKLIYSGLDLI